MNDPNEPHFDPTPTKYDVATAGAIPVWPAATLVPQTPTADPLGRWAPYARWAVTVALLLIATLWPRAPALPPLPTAEAVAGLSAAVMRIEAGQVRVSKAAGLPPKE